jgi:hypothetical protein
LGKPRILLFFCEKISARLFGLFSGRRVRGHVHQYDRRWFRKYRIVLQMTWRTWPPFAAILGASTPPLSSCCCCKVQASDWMLCVVSRMCCRKSGPSSSTGSRWSCRLWVHRQSSTNSNSVFVFNAHRCLGYNAWIHDYWINENCGWELVGLS